MKIKQISVSIENSPERLYEITQALANAKINLRALIPVSIALSIIYVVILFLPGIHDRIISIPQGIAETGGSGRFELWKRSLDLWMSSPILGCGLAEAKRHIGKVVHNGFLQIR